MAGNDTFVEILEGEVFKHYYDGEWRASASGKSVDIINPTTRKNQYRV
jgi:glyceraldehyde-3-phosphate dehydrogenase (NADP+)